MKFLLELQNKQRKLFEKGGKLERLYPLFEANDTFLFTSDEVTKHPSHVRDGADLKRIMITVVVALVPCMLMAMYNTGYQAALAAVAEGGGAWAGWQTRVFEALGFEFAPGNVLACFFYGALFYVPVYIMTLAAGGLAEVVFAIVRKHEINEGFLVTSALIPLIMPPTVPLWQVAMATLFGIVVGKEVFGGVGMNIFNPALTTRAFLFFAYPGQISGDKVWIAAQTGADGVSGATWLARTAAEGKAALVDGGLSWWDAFLGFIPGSMGETSTLCCIFGAIVLIVTGVGAWRTMAGVVMGSFVLSGVLNLAGSATNPAFNVPFYWHWVLGGFAFATVFMATDPVSSTFTNTGKWIYGFMIGVLGILVRVLNPAYPEGWMLAILFMNMFAPLIDYFVVRANIKRRMARYAA
jgi:Na+-transporting NADH:ubiquinone oxidoreductase subunit B